MSRPTFADAQRWFFDLVVRGERGDGSITDWLTGDETHALTRANVYRGGYFARMHEVLVDDFARVATLVDREAPDAFADLCAEYLSRHLSTQPSLRYAGERFAAFLSEHPLLERHPFLADLARLEWARVEAFDAPDAEPMRLDALAAIPAESWAEARFLPSAALRFLETRWPVHDAWARLDEGETVPPLLREATTLFVWRREFAVYHRAATSAEEADALRRLAAGAPFAEVCEAYASSSIEEAAPRALHALQQFIVDGMLIAS